MMASEKNNLHLNNLKGPHERQRQRQRDDSIIHHGSTAKKDHES